MENAETREWPHMHNTQISPSIANTHVKNPPGKYTHTIPRVPKHRVRKPHVTKPESQVFPSSGAA